MNVAKLWHVVVEVFAISDCLVSGVIIILFYSNWQALGCNATRGSLDTNTLTGFMYNKYSENVCACICLLVHQSPSSSCQIIYLKTIWKLNLSQPMIVERLTISRHVTVCYQLSTLVCLVLFCCCLLHCDNIHLSPVSETMRCKVFYTKQRKHNYLFVT